MPTIADAIEILEKINADLEPELLTGRDALSLIADYSRAERLAAFGVATLTRKLRDVTEIARVTGTSIGKARSTVATGQALAQSDDLNLAMQTGTISLDQASEIAAAVESAPASAAELVSVAQSETFNVLRDKARKAKLDTEQHLDLASRQHSARRAGSYLDGLGMGNIHLSLKPHVGTPLVARAEAEAQRLGRAVPREEREPFERYLADAYAKLLGGQGKGRAKRPELVVLVSHEVAKRGWTDVRKGETCKIPGVGPVSPQVAREIAEDAFINAVICDGKNLMEWKRWSRDIPVEIQVALELGEGPGFDGVSCTDCGNRFKTEFDHVEPRSRGGPTSQPNLRPRCWPCHQAKTKRDRRTKPP